MEAIDMKAFGPYVPPETRKLNGEIFSLAWVTGFKSKSKVDKIKSEIKKGCGKSYKVRLVQNEGAYWVYTKPKLTSEDSRKIAKRFG